MTVGQERDKGIRCGTCLLHFKTSIEINTLFNEKCPYEICPLEKKDDINRKESPKNSKETNSSIS